MVSFGGAKGWLASNKRYEKIIDRFGCETAPQTNISRAYNLAFEILYRTCPYDAGSATMRSCKAEDGLMMRLFKRLTAHLHAQQTAESTPRRLRYFLGLV